MLAADDLPCAGPGLHGLVDLIYLQFLQEAVIPGQHQLADDLTDFLTVQVHVIGHMFKWCSQLAGVDQVWQFSGQQQPQE